MFDTFSRAVDQANQRGEFLSITQIDTLIEISAKAETRLDIINLVAKNATKIVADTARALFVEQPQLIAPGGNAYTNRRMASCLRDMEIILRYVTYAMLAGDSSVLDDRCLNGLRETYLAIGTPPSSVGRAIQIIKEIVISTINEPGDNTLALVGNKNHPAEIQISTTDEPRDINLEDSSTLMSELAGYFDRAWTAVAVGFPPEEDIMTNSYFNYAQDSYLSYVRRLTQKRVATAEELAMYYLLSDGRVEIRTGDRVFLLEREDEQDSLDNDEKRIASAIHPYWNTSVNAPEKAGCPAQVDHRSNQTSI